ncbi:hypothetical protein MHYP_G00233590 [Metynnis hypsauchen]
MGCTASVVLLQALRSLLRGSCARAHSRQQERISLDVPLPQDGEEADSRPRTIIVMVTRLSLPLSFLPLFRSASQSDQHVLVVIVEEATF